MPSLKAGAASFRALAGTEMASTLWLISWRGLAEVNLHTCACMCLQGLACVGNNNNCQRDNVPSIMDLVGMHCSALHCCTVSPQHLLVSGCQLGEQVLLDQAVWQVQQCPSSVHNCDILAPEVLQVQGGPAMLGSGVQPHPAARCVTQETRRACEAGHQQPHMQPVHVGWQHKDAGGLETANLPRQSRRESTRQPNQGKPPGPRPATIPDCLGTVYCNTRGQRPPPASDCPQ